MRRFHCDIASCAQHMFAEQKPHYVCRYARRTESLDDQLLLLAWAVGSEEGSRVAEGFKASVSADTLLRLIPLHI